MIALILAVGREKEAVAREARDVRKEAVVRKAQSAGKEKKQEITEYGGGESEAGWEARDERGAGYEKGA